MPKHTTTPQYDPFNPDPDKRTFDPDNPVGIGLACPVPNCPTVATGATKAEAEMGLAFHVNENHPRRASDLAGSVQIDNIPDTLQDSKGKPITE